jgi:uncharacterized membrane protein/sporulation protein YlmC with PRC-barrel domain
MSHIPMEAKVQCTDGPCGTSVAVIVHPIRQQVTHLVIQDQATLQPTQRLVPIDQVAETTSDLIRLRCTKEQFDGMEPFLETHYVESDQSVLPAAGMVYPAYVPPLATVDDATYFEVVDERVPLGERAIHRGVSVEATDGLVGKVGELVVDPETDEITHFVLQKGHAWGKKDITLPLSAIRSVGEDTVYLKLDKAAIQQLPAIPLKRHHWYADPELELIAKLYSDLAKAQEGLQFVQDLHNRKILKIRNAAVFARDAEGAVTVKDVRDIDAKKGRLLGAITGGLIGLLGGPGGVVIGALAGAGTGTVAGKRIDFGFSDKFLNNLKDHLQPGSAALVVLVEHEFAVPLSESLAGDEGIIVQQALTDRLVEELMAQDEAEA